MEQDCIDLARKGQVAIGNNSLARYTPRVGVKPTVNLIYVQPKWGNVNEFPSHCISYPIYAKLSCKWNLCLVDKMRG